MQNEKNASIITKTNPSLVGVHCISVGKHKSSKYDFRIVLSLQIRKQLEQRLER
jgi:hypothetical protein